jgi:hypothetical protein
MMMMKRLSGERRYASRLAVPDNFGITCTAFSSLMPLRSVRSATSRHSALSSCSCQAAISPFGISAGSACVLTRSSASYHFQTGRWFYLDHRVEYKQLGMAHLTAL